MSAAPSGPAKRRRSWLLAGAVLLALLLLVVQVLGTPLHAWLKLQVFDGYQLLFPRQRHSAPAVVVNIDEASIAKYGQWPWPRTLTANLLDRIADYRPAVIGIDIIMPEPDRMSPTRIPDFAPHMDVELAQRLRALLSNDAVLARALHERPVVLGVAGIPAGTPGTLDRTPSAVPFVARGGDPFAYVTRFERVLQTIAEIDVAASGRGLLNVIPEGGMVRRVTLLAAVGDTLMPALPLEMLRVAAGERSFDLTLDGTGVRSVRLGDLSIPSLPDGRLWLHFAPHDPARLVSAADVLEGKVDAGQLAGKAVIVGVTALGLVDRPETPLGWRMSGAEIHVQTLENIFDASWLSRPTWAAFAEAVWLIVACALGVAVLLRLPTRAAAVVGFGLLFIGPTTGFLLYRDSRLLVDGITPTLGFAALFGVMLAATLAESERRRRELNIELAATRDATARFEGELEAARRVQLGMLPFAPDVVGHEPRADIDAYMQPARMVGGDLYDFFSLDDDHLFISVGDVSGKGMGASMFMGVTKALTKSAALRVRESVGYIVTEANADLAADNPDNLFVTMVAGILHLADGGFEYCNAGHDAPYLVRAGGPIERLALEGGPPLCVLDDFAYSGASAKLAAGDTLILFTDGLTEATNDANELYGHVRLRATLERVGGDAPIDAMADAIRSDVDAFVRGAEQSDDFTLVLVRWKGAQAGLR